MQQFRSGDNSGETGAWQYGEIEALEKEVEWQKKHNETVTEELLGTISEKNKLSRQLKRVNKGVCPCCNRTFVNLANHMKTTHPEK